MKFDRINPTVGDHPNWSDWSGDNKDNWHSDTWDNSWSNSWSSDSNSDK